MPAPMRAWLNSVVIIILASAATFVCQVPTDQGSKHADQQDLVRSGFAIVARLSLYL